MWKFIIFLLVGIFLLAFFWPTQRKSSLRATPQIEKQSVSHTPVSAPGINIITKNIEKVSRLEIPDEESIGNECFVQLGESAKPKLEHFAKKFIADPAAPVGLWMYDTASPIKATQLPSASDFFLRGLAAADLMAGRENKKPDFNMALELLLKAKDKDSNNAAILVYAAYVQKQLGREQEAKELLDQVNIEEMKFETYEVQAIHQMYKHVQNATDALNSYNIRAQMPIVDPTKIKSFLVENKKQEVGYLMIPNELEPESDPEGGIIFQLVGSYLIRDISSADYNKLPSRQDLQEKWNNHPQYKVINATDLARDCSLEKIQPLVDYFQDLVQ